MHLFRSVPPRQIELANIMLEQAELSRRLLRVSKDGNGPLTSTEQRILEQIERSHLEFTGIAGLVCKRLGALSGNMP